MHAVNLYIDEIQNANSFNSLKNGLMTDDHVVNVAYHLKMPHDMLVEYDESYVTPSTIVDRLESQGLHVDITGG